MEEGSFGVVGVGVEEIEEVEGFFEVELFQVEFGRYKVNFLVFFGKVSAFFSLDQSFISF